MLKIFVAEDQLLIQKDLCVKLMKTSTDISIVGTALNGMEALEKVRELKPDILFTDIRMPGLTGLELVSELNASGLLIHTVVISGYRDFEYARQSMKLGIDEYLLKPVSIEDLHYILNNLADKIHTSQEERILLALQAMLTNPGDDVPSIVDTFGQKFSCFYSILINVGPYSTLTIHDNLLYEDYLTSLSAAELLHGILTLHDQIYLLEGKTKNEKFLLLCLEEGSTIQIEDIAELLLTFLDTSGYPVTLCISSKIRRLSDLGIKYNLMRTQMENYLTFGYSSILRQEDFFHTSADTHHLLDDATLRRFRSDIQSKNSTLFLRHLEEFLERCRQEKVTQKNLGTYLKQILHDVLDRQAFDNSVNYSLEIEEYLSNSRDYGDLTSSLLFLFEQAFRRITPDIGTYLDSAHFAGTIKNYIQAHYSQEINIHDIALHFSITPAYLSRLFKKNEGIPPIEYLTRYRIEQACRHFDSSSLSIKEVSELCGYSNQFYFSKAFKQIVGMSPSKYRIMHHID